RKCATNMHSVIWNTKLFEDHRFLKLLNCIFLWESINGKSSLTFNHIYLDVFEKNRLQNDLIRAFLALHHFQAAVDTFEEMELPSKNLATELIRRSRLLHDYDSALRVAKKVGELSRVIYGIVIDLHRLKEHHLALRLIRKNAHETNAARLVFVVCAHLKQ